MNTTTLPRLSLAEELPAELDYLVVGIRLEADGSVSHSLPEDVDAGPLDLDLLSSGAERRTKLGTTTSLGRLSTGARVVAVGLGAGLPSPDALRRGAGAAVRWIGAGLDDGAGARVGLLLHHEGAAGAMSVHEMVRATAEGGLLGGYRTLHPVGTVPEARIGEVVVLDRDATDHESPARHAIAVTAAVARARDWVNAPANLLFPESFADELTRWFDGSPVEMDVLDEDRLRTEGFGGVLAVGGGSAHRPRVVRAAYSPEGAAQKLVLVGKGVTFDSGGIDIKPAGRMLTMKSDMGGAAAVMTALRAIADLGLRVEVVAYAGLVENMPSGTAYRPSDILTMRDGTTVEVTNTDAEGRLVLADCLAAAQVEDADLVVDIATLTGACIRALGPSTIGLVANSDLVAGRLLHSAESSGEAMWQLPLTDEARDKLESPYADLASASTETYLGMQIAAAFLEHFVGDAHWAHLDIAGPAWHDGAPEGHLSSGGTGAGVRTLVDLALTLE
ncbi:leucyl aminopeptidase [Raineyella antarctica]|uniref:Probable cytosol aminopeptidase n=1 Tax=Raineyella antarctica TaxID=1577474 RepID=A0A1G6GDP1_9ACTN|nr:leucyl aminopeptidase [Raineyella antarctica]SDB80107.1 leucyl aminopeptidase [Raineyella antarctica]